MRKRGYHGGRYTCVNLQNSDTVEFRVFRGTLKTNTRPSRSVSELRTQAEVSKSARTELCDNAQLAELLAHFWAERTGRGINAQIHPIASFSKRTGPGLADNRNTHYL